MAEIGQLWYCARCGYGTNVPVSTASNSMRCPQCGSSSWSTVQPRIEPRAPAPLFQVHIAGDPHEGLQACRRCAAVLIEESVIPSIAATVEYFPAGATITIGPGCAAIGADPRGTPCR